ncbi:Transporter, major facilitator family protein [uncultured Eubacteriales bacterium]|uniref:Transporter, major facilitator family protein n=1 Tax=uncultured Eubacteriales bacterium TaxID=172733 RepID=A0A212JK45_9FIRM|nr:Transporter, major facilitator family protein [uncultured Eubacteriales bacterium]
MSTDVMTEGLTAARVHGGRRWLYAGVGLVVLLAAGFVYGWSIFSAPIGADFPEWTAAQLSLAFTICIAFFCLGGFLAGNLSKRIPVRVNVLFSAAMFLAGFFLVSRAQSLPMLYVSYGVLCGTASGFAYNSVMSTMTRWFPDCQGMISGVLLLGFGSSSMILGSLFNAATPARAGAWRHTFLVMGVVIAAVVALGALFFKLPPPDPAAPKARRDRGQAGRDLTPAQMVRTPCFWFFFLWMALISGVGLAVISQARHFAAAIGAGVEGGTITLAVGLISVCNGLGRAIFGGVFDTLGWKRTMTIVNGVSLVGVALLAAALFTGWFPLVAAGFIVTGLAYGGAPTMGSALVGDFFGQKNYPVNFSIVNMNLLLASFAGTLAGVLYDGSGSYVSTLAAIALCSAAAFAIMHCIRRPK